MMNSRNLHHSSRLVIFQFFAAVILGTSNLPKASSFVANGIPPTQPKLRRRRLHGLEASSSLSNEDWRDFRAKLVGAATFEAGALIEKGSIVLSLVEETLGCHDLNQPYLHKAMVLVLDHVEGDFTKGILLNRPTDLVLTDEDIVYVDEEGSLVAQQEESNARNGTKAYNEWPIFFGGDLAGLFDEEQQPMIVCLHRRQSTLDNKRAISDAQKLDAVLSDISVTSHADACAMIASGQATADDFFTFYGFCGWEAGQLLREIKRGSWTMVTTDADTVWDALKSQTMDPRGGGIRTWEKFANLIEKDCSKGRGSFSDLMLKSWTSEMLRLARENEEDTSYDDADLERVLDIAVAGPHVVESGMVMRASSVPTRYLLREQYLHKSIILVLHESDEASVGLVLNLPTTDTFTLETPRGENVEFAIRYGGAGGVSGEETMIWLHCSRSLRSLGIGNSMNADIGSQIWVCTVDQVKEAIDLGLALPREFLVIQGFSVWEKQQQGSAGGIAGQLRSGKLELVPSRLVDNVWSLLQAQDCLSEGTLDWNMQSSFHAWNIAGLETKSKPRDAETFVFESDVSVSDLADVALIAWTRIFLLGDAEYAPS